MATSSLQRAHRYPDREMVMGAFLCILAAALLSVIDDRWLSQVALTWRHPMVVPVLAQGTWLGDWRVVAGFLLLAVGVGSLLRRPRLRAAGISGLYALILSGLFTLLLKHTICRTRPLLIEAGTFHPPLCFQNGIDSFPSGHTTHAFAMAVILAGASPRLTPLFYGLAAMVGLSRVVLEVHFPADVVAGAGMGLLCGTLCRRQSQPLSWLERR